MDKRVAREEDELEARLFDPEWRVQDRHVAIERVHVLRHAKAPLCEKTRLGLARGATDDLGELGAPGPS